VRNGPRQDPLLIITKGKNMFDKMKALIEMQKKIQELKRELDSMDFEIISFDNLVKIKMSGSQEVKEVNIMGDLSAVEKTDLEKIIKDTYNRAIKHSQDLAAEKMKAVTGLNIPGLI
jgi:DNA-binding protein YbaB